MGVARPALWVLLAGVMLLGCERERRAYRYPPPGPYGYAPPPGAYGAPPPAPAATAATPAPLPPAPRAGAAGARYGALSAPECLAELGRRGIAHKPATQPAPGVEIPLRLAGQLHGVSVIGAGASQIGTGSAHDILDCRLALALDDFTGLLAARGIVRVDHMSMYRSGAKIAGKGTTSQHAFGLAIDIGSLRRADGQALVVQRDWTTARGSTPCPGPPLEAGAALALRDVVCSSLREGTFNTFITPNHNAAHANHFHFDLVLGEPGVFAE